MTELPIFTICTYLTVVEDIQWRPDDYTANKMVKVLKEEEFGGYFEYRRGGQRIRITNESRANFHPTVHSVLSNQLVQRFSKGTILVPIPNSHVTAPDTPGFRTRAIAEGVAAASGGHLKCEPVLVFAQPMQKTHNTPGARDPRGLRDNYRLVGKPSGPVVLIDDVITSGAHLIGATWRLNAEGYEVLGGAAWAKSTKEQPEKVFDLHQDTLDLADAIAEFRDFL